jgi:hypothetical protein
LITGQLGSGYPLGMSLADFKSYLSFKLNIMLINVPNSIIIDGMHDSNKLFGKYFFFNFELTKAIIKIMPPIIVLATFIVLILSMSFYIFPKKSPLIFT